MRTLRIAALNDTENRANWGCKATSVGMRLDVEDALSPDFRVEWSLIPYARRPLVDRFAQTLAGSKFHRELIDPLLIPQALEKWVPRMHGGDAMSKVRAADLCIFSAEGSLMDREFADSTRMLLLPAYAARVLKKPLISLNQSLFGARPEFIQELRGVYGLSSWNAVREPASLSFAQAHHLGEFELLPDAAFRTIPSQKCGSEFLDREIEGPYLCLSSSGAIRHADTHPHFETAVEWARTKGWKVVALNWRTKDRDRIRAKFPDVIFPKPNATYQEIAAVLREARVVVGGRYHMALIASMSGTPSIDFPSGTHKTVGLQQLLGTDSPALGFADAKGLEERLNSFDWTEADRANLIQRVKTIQRNRLEMLPKLRKAILEAIA
jgi:polysaccharide pyruvyl transferase WcaK-like protein